MSLDIHRAKKRLFAMLAIDGVCALVAVAAAVGAFMFGVGWMQWLILAAILAGFAAQIWFIAGVRRTDTEA